MKTDKNLDETRDASTYEMTSDTDSCTQTSPTKKKRRRTRSVGPYSAVGRRLSAASSAFSMPTNLVEPSIEQSTTSSTNFFAMSKEKKFTVITFCIANFFVGSFYSILAPFFPTEAYKKGVSSTIVGFIFGSFELTLVLASPIFRSIICRVGAKFMYITGIFVCGVGAILFGFLDRSPDGTIYIVMCFLVRFIEALGAAAFSTASFTIMAHTFPENVATMFGTLELFYGLGLMVGPPIGGALFQLGGFILPFISLGSMLLLVGFTSAFLLPSQDVERLPSEGSVFSILRIPIIPITGFCLVCGSGCIGYLDVTLSVFLSESFHLPPVILGLIFLVGPGAYAIMAPIWGWIVDKTPRLNKYFIATGSLLGGISFFFMGPAPFFHLPTTLWLVICSLTVMGLGISTLVISFQVIAEATLAAGYSDNLATYGLIAGVFNSFFSAGAFIGPLGGGYLHDMLGFEMASVIIGCCAMLSSLTLFIFILISTRCPPSNHDPEKESLLKHSIASERKDSEHQASLQSIAAETTRISNGVIGNHDSTTLNGSIHNHDSEMLNGFIHNHDSTTLNGFIHNHDSTTLNGSIGNPNSTTLNGSIHNHDSTTLNGSIGNPDSTTLKGSVHNNDSLESLNGSIGNPNSTTLNGSIHNIDSETLNDSIGNPNSTTLNGSIHNHDSTTLNGSIGNPDSTTLSGSVHNNDSLESLNGSIGNPDTGASNGFVDNHDVEISNDTHEYDAGNFNGSSCNDDARTREHVERTSSVHSH